jgi:hypothetical protein
MKQKLLPEPRRARSMPVEGQSEQDGDRGSHGERCTDASE